MDRAALIIFHSAILRAFAVLYHEILPNPRRRQDPRPLFAAGSGAALEDDDRQSDDHRWQKNHTEREAGYDPVGTDHDCQHCDLLRHASWVRGTDLSLDFLNALPPRSRRVGGSITRDGGNCCGLNFLHDSYLSSISLMVVVHSVSSLRSHRARAQALYTV